MSSDPIPGQTEMPFLKELDLVLANKSKLALVPREKSEDVSVKIENRQIPTYSQINQAQNQGSVVLNSCGSTTDLITLWQNRVRFNIPPENQVVMRRTSTKAFSRFSNAVSHLNFRQHPNKTQYELEGMEKEELFQILFHLFDRKQQGYLNQYQWIEFLKVRLIGIGPEKEEKWVEFVFLLESTAYSVCGDGNVDFENFCKIFGDKDVLSKFFRLIDEQGNGVASAEMVMEFISKLMNNHSSNQLNKENILTLEKLFRTVVGNGDFIRKEDFKQIIPTKNEFFVDRAFDIFNQSGSGFISLAEFLDAMHQFSSGENPDAKIRFLFKVYDADQDGVIKGEELETVIRACMSENGMKFSCTQTAQLTEALFEDAAVDGKGGITFEALKSQLEKHPENMSSMLDQWLVPLEKHKKRSCIKTPHQFTANYIKNNYVYLIWYYIFIITNIALFTTRFIHFHLENPDAIIYLVIARSAGQCLNFNCTFIVILMLRHCLTFLRSRGASFFLPIDQNIKFHKITGILTFFFGVLHTIMHLINIAEGIIRSTGSLGDCVAQNMSCPINSGNWSYSEFLFNPRVTSQSGVFSMGLIPGYAFNTGVVLIIILTIMAIGSSPCLRRGGSFQIFYWTHLLYYLFWTLLIIHAPQFWMWFVIPGTIFLIEQAFRYYNWKVGRGHTWVSSGILLPSKVTHVVIRRPPNFDFHPGDYVFVRIPNISKYEWHPFTISSAPEHQDAIWLHVRACGQWTTRLFQYFEAEQAIVFDSKKATDIQATSAAVNISNAEKLPIFMTPKSKLKSSQSFHTSGREPMRKREIDLESSPRSISAYELGNYKSKNRDESARRAAARSFKYVRNKPQIIAFQTPSEKQGESVEEEQNVNEIGSETQGGGIGMPLEIHLDGPYGAPSSHIFRAEHAILIATGIGVTPFASILQSIMHRYWASRNCCPNCNFKWCNELMRSVLNLKKVDFFWINRDQKCFEWFVQLLSQLEIEQAESGVMERFLDMHMYITSALQKTDMKAVGLQLALDLLHEKEKRDLITGLKTRTNAGRPNWNKIFQQISDQKKGKVTVFYCGPPALARTLKFKCDEFGFTFRKENF
ncbi:NADPH oxidase 5, partial [Orchesella cincta]